MYALDLVLALEEGGRPGMVPCAWSIEIVERLTDAMAAVEGESMRKHIVCIVQEIASGDWSVGGQTLAADDIRALARSDGDTL